MLLDISDVQAIILAIKKHEIIDYYKIPEEFRDIQEVIKAEREENMRVISTRGYDVVRQQFFVDEFVKTELGTGEVISRHITTALSTFEEFYSFLDGNIYEESCYFQYSFSKEQIDNYRIDLNRINTQSFVSDSVDDCIPEEYIDSKENYAEGENNRRNIARWIAKYNKCNSSEELIDVNEKHKKSKDETDELFYLWNYINAHGEAVFDTIMGFVSNGAYPAYRIEEALPFIFCPERLAESYHYTSGSKSTCARHKAKFKEYLKRISEEEYTTRVDKYFCDDTHYYCIRTDYFFMKKAHFNFPFASVYRYYSDFSVFAEALNNDLSDCNLLHARGIEVSPGHIINENTKLPITDINQLNKSIKKEYDRYRDVYVVTVKWSNNYGKTIYKQIQSFDYFFDFLQYLNNDLSYANLLYCSGLKYLTDYSMINFNKALVTSNILDEIGEQYDQENVISVLPEDNEEILKNEESTALVFQDVHEELPCGIESNDTGYSDNKVYYVSDIHLIHKIKKSGAKTKGDIICVIQRIIDSLLRDIDALWKCKVLLIGGDVSSEFDIFEQFVRMLRKTIDELSYDVIVIFVLGNHEFWNQEGKSVDDIVKMYRHFLNKYGMYLLHDEILFMENYNTVSVINKEDILSLDVKQIRDRTRKARLILFGGIGFAGCNEKFNASKGIYLQTINREQEIRLSESFSYLYSRVEAALGNRSIIVFTHMNINEWKHETVLHDRWIYVSGHSHINAYYDDGITRLYADNQIGYYNNQVRSKYFLIDNTYDCFVDYEDGIYEITRNDYIDFYRGKNLPITFNRECLHLYMLKRNEYYCFIIQNKSGKLSMLNGGALKGLSRTSIEYYFRNMEAQIGYIKTPLMKYQEFQQMISKEIKNIGGSGRIHGAIIDIDGKEEKEGWSSIAYNHLYVNPINMVITPYYAIDMVIKYVYPSFQALISNKCPRLFENYNKLLATEEKNAILIQPYDRKELCIKPILYMDTDIYKASRELRKMQKLNSNILCTWIESIPTAAESQSKTKDLTHNEYYIDKG